MAHKYVYLFSEGDGSMRELLGGKGCGLAEMTKAGMPVPQGFTITTEACLRYYADGEFIADEIVDEIFENMTKMEAICGKKFGDLENPLLVSVRSGARASMPGMMDTILNLGLNEEVVEVMAKRSGNARWAWDCYRRFIQMYSDVVMEVGKKYFEELIAEAKAKKGITNDLDLTAEDLKALAMAFKAEYKAKVGSDFPTDPKKQLLGAVKAVFRSWDNPRAIAYRRMNGIPHDWGTAVNVQMMVFGNMGDDCGTGVAFSRDPSTGEDRFYGEFLMNAQGEDVVAGVRTPQSISQLKATNPEAYKQFKTIAKKLEKHYKDMQDMEFTIENGKLYMLQCRNGKRTAFAALKIAVDMVNEGLLTREEALLKIDPAQLNSLLFPQFDPRALKNAEAAAKGLAASPGAACGHIHFTAEDARDYATKKYPVLLVRNETTTEDIEGMAASQGILTATGGRTSHAAVVARGMGRCCVSGCSGIRIDETAKTLTIGDTVLKEGDWVSIDGSTGNVYIGQIPTVEASVSGDFATVMQWADDVRTLWVRANADTPADAARAVTLGAEGIGLTRTEHMFFDFDRIPVMRQMILSDTPEQRREALAKLLPMQRKDFEGIYKAMAGRPVTIRLLDPPLHEFLPTTEEEIAELAKEMGKSAHELAARIRSLHEVNPMMGHRGCRLPVTYSEIAEMQAQAIVEAAINVNKKCGYRIEPEIMIPLVCEAKELRYVKDIVCQVADRVIAERGAKLLYHIGTMIEIPRAALTADELATEAEFFSFGTNDLTQMTFGFSRDDAARFLPNYYAKNILEFDPFERLDQNGVGTLVEMAAKKGRSTRPEIHLGVCGEHGGEPSSVEFCHRIGLNYVSCSPFRVPIARLAAAQAQLRYPR